MAQSDLISETRVVPAPAGAIFELLVHPARHSEIDGSGSVRGTQPGTPDRLSLGARFGMRMRIGVPYKIMNTVVEYDEGRLIAWRHFAGHRWRYILEPVDPNSTRVTEQFDPSPAARPGVYRVLGFRSRNRRAITETLNRLQDWARTRR